MNVHRSTWIRIGLGLGAVLMMACDVSDPLSKTYGGDGDVSSNAVSLASLTYSADFFTENFETDDGRVQGEILIIVNDDVFAFEGRTLVEGEQYAFDGLPFGIQPSITMVDSKTAKLAFTGNAAAHEPTDSVKVQFKFLNEAFSSKKLAQSSEKEMSITFVDNPAINVASVSFGTKIFTETDRVIPTIIPVVVSGTTFANETFVAGTHYQLSGTPIPTGFTMKVERLSDTQARIFLSGSTNKHAKSNSVQDVLFEFTSRAFTLQAVPTNATHKANFAVNFIDTPFAQSIIVYEAGDFDGNLINRDNVDTLCFATQPDNLVNQVKFHGLISFNSIDQIVSMAARFAYRSDITIRSKNGTILSEDWAEMLDATLEKSLFDAGVLANATDEWWSGSAFNGTLDPDNCLNWTSNSMGVSGQAGLANQQNNAQWINFASASPGCDQFKKVLCVAAP